MDDDKKTSKTSRVSAYGWLMISWLVTLGVYSADHWAHDFAFIQCLHAPGMSKAACAEFGGIASADIDGLTSSQVILRSVRRSMEEAAER